MTLAPGSLVAGRFTLQRKAGRGGMGSVFLARDEQTGLPVALKLLHSLSHPEAVQRFAREAQVLASLRHPGIVSYVAHGLIEDGLPFLAMEWLEGEDLAQRLNHTPLRPADSLRMLRRAAEALSAAHAQGIVHRDLKPSNLFMRASQPGDVVLLDFGLAHIHTASQALTGSAMVLGTPGYMAPEQASSLRDISPSADIFSLGCVLYECLSGQPPFRAAHLAAVLAKILFSEPVPLRASRPDLPASLQALVEKMLAKEPSQRPSDAGQLLRALEALDVPLELSPPNRAAAVVARRLEPTITVSGPPAPVHTEQQLVSVLLATPSSPSKEGPALNPDEGAQTRQHLQLLLRNIQAHGAHAALLADGSLLAAFILERGTATDQAALAARCALSIKEHWQNSLVALTTGLSLRGHPLPVGEAVDRAGELLQLQKNRPAASSSQVWVDDTTAGLLDSRFQLEKASSGMSLLSGELLSVDESRPLLGRPTSCIGREQELTLLEMAFSSCIEDCSARALLITAPAGTGKSRLRHELLRRLKWHAQPPLMLLGRGDPMNTSAAHGLVGQALRRGCDVVDGEPLAARRAKLAQRVIQHLAPEQHQEVTEFLGELCAIPFPGEDSPRLRAAREDPQLMNAQVTQALVTWLKAECARHPVLLMLEDLHWSDGPSIKLVEEVLRELSEQPLLVLALARPEVKELFPGLWAKRAQEVPLRGLSQKASTRLVREVLGPEVPDTVVARLVGQAAGNALFLEELIRGVAEGHGEETPGSILAMLQSRLLRLAPEAKRVVMAASIFGRHFWAGGAGVLLELTGSPRELEHWLRMLVDLELIERQPVSRFPAESEYRFHHALVRDAAYSLVPNSLRTPWHRQAGEWLEAAGESEPLVLAEHYNLGEQKQKAIHFFIRACKQNCERQRTDVQGAQRCLKAALACEPTGQTLTELQVLEVDISFWMDDVARTIAVSNELLPKLAEGSLSWIQVLGNFIMICAKSGRPQEVVALGQHLLSIEPAADAIPAYSEALAFLGVMYQWTGQLAASRAVITRMGEVARRGQEHDSFAHGWWCTNQSAFAHDHEARPWASRQLAEEGLEAFGKVGAARNQLVTRAGLGRALASLGDLPRAIEVMRAGLTKARYFDQAGAWLQVHMALLLSGSSERAHLEEARRLALHTCEEEHTNPMHTGIARLVLAQVALAQGSPSEAEPLAREAGALLGTLPEYWILTSICLSAALLALERVQEARAEAEQGVRIWERMGGAGATAVGAWLMLAETCQAQKDDAAAEAALRRALECLRLRLRDLPDEASRERFLSRVPTNARALRLARERWGESMDGLAP